MIAVPAGKFTQMVGEYVAEKTGMDLKPDMYQAMMVIDDDKNFIAGVVISNFRGTDVEISCASESPAAWRPHVCKAVFTYIFEQLGCVRCTSITVRTNKKARSFLESLGFQLEGNLRQAYDGKRDALVYGLLKSECRYLGDLKELEHGQEKRPDATDTAGPGSDGERPSTGEHEGGDDPGGIGPDQSEYAAG
jgi:hypothetical protein